MGQHYFADEAHIRALVGQMRSARLSLPPGLDTDDIPLLCRIYNGIGPEAWSAPLRRLCTLMLELFEPEALIHDWEYVYQPKDRKHFTRANIRFAWNAVLYAVRTADVVQKILTQAGAGIVLALICQLWGWEAFKISVLPPEQEQDERNTL